MRIQQLNTSLQTQNSSRLKLVQENAQLLTKFQQEQTHKQTNFKILFQGLNSLAAQLQQKDEPASAKPVDKAQQQLILKLHSEELQERNEEIVRLRTILDGVEVPAEEAHLRNTIKHLRTELARHNKIILSILRKEEYA